MRRTTNDRDRTMVHAGLLWGFLSGLLAGMVVSALFLCSDAHAASWDEGPTSPNVPGSLAPARHDFHDMWLGIWKAHTAPWPGWEKVTRTLIRDLQADRDGDGKNESYAGLFYGTETCTAQFASEQDEIDHGTRVDEYWTCVKTGEVQIAEADRLTKYATLLHELTHARDWLVMTDQERVAFLTTMGYPVDVDHPLNVWDTPLRPGGWRTPRELYAEAGEFCGLSGRQRRLMGYFWGPISGRLDGGVYRWRPTHEQAHVVCEQLRDRSPSYGIGEGAAESSG